MGKYKRTVTFVISIIMSVYMIWLLHSALQPPVLPLGASMPAIIVETAAGSDTLKPALGKTTVMMLFNRQCSHCLYELDQFEHHIDRLADIHLWLATTEKSFRPGSDNLQWPALARAKNVTWACMAVQDFKRGFGSPVSPSFYIFNAQGLLQEKIKGEVKLERLIASFK